MTATIMLTKESEVAVDGPLNFSTVTKLRKQGIRFITQQGQLTFNLANVTAEDNSGLALLSAWSKYALQQKKNITFINVPQQLLAIAKLCGLEHILPISDSRAK